MQKFIKEIEDLGLYLHVKGENLVLTNKSGTLNDEDINEINRRPHIPDFIRSNKKDIIAYINENNLLLDKKNIDAIYELSGSQTGIYFHTLYLLSAEQKDYSTNHTQNYVDISSHIDVPNFYKAWETVIKKHTILRTGFISDKTKVPLQFVNKEVDVPFKYLDYSHVPDKEAKLAFETYRQEDLTRKFNLKQPPLMRITLFKFGEAKYAMIWTRHHLLLDGWSNQILIKELVQYYEQFLQGKTADAQKEDRFEDHIKYLRTIDAIKEKEFWQKIYKDYEQPLLLPFTADSAERNKGNGVFKKNYIQFDAAYTEKIVTFSKGLHITANTLLQGVWVMLLSRYTHSKDVILGVTVSGRPAHSDYDNKVGNFINTLPFRFLYNDNESGVEFLTRMQELNVELRNHQYSSIKNIKEWCGISEELFDCLWIFNNFPISDKAGSEEKSLRIDSVYSEGNNNYLLTILLTLKDKLTVEFTYNSSLIQDEYIHMMAGHVKHVLVQLVADASVKLSAVELLAEEEQLVLLHTFNNASVIHAANRSVLDAFSQQVNKDPGNVAVIFKQTSITYGELNACSNRLAHYLISKYKVTANDLVGINLRHSEWLVVSVFGILKSGAAYVPLDPKLPQERIETIKRESNCKVIIDDAFIALFTEEGEQVDEDPAVIIDPDQLAYVLYTSGSTGIPKGVMIEHGSLMNYLAWATGHYLANNTVKPDFGLFTTLSFDLTVTSLFLPLLNGGSLKVFDSGLSVIDLLKEYLESKLAYIKLTPAHIGLLAEIQVDYCNIHSAIVGGDILVKDHIKILRQLNPAMKIYNEYGPTEATVGCVVYEVPEDAKLIHIGKPIANTKIYILNEQLNLVPPGVEGELYIAGEGLARGYFNRPHLTSEKFIDHPFLKCRIYKTGDVAKWLPDGNISYLGRNDDQVKIRGFRVELEEVRSTLQTKEGVDKVVVLATDTNEGTKKIVAYVVANRRLDAMALQNYIADRLPEYMIPAQFVFTDDIPLNNNGKIDKKKLLALNLQEVKPETGYVAPADDTEINIAKIWTRILKQNDIGRYDNFFKLGGHSLNVIQLAQQYWKTFNVKLPLKRIFELTTLESHALLIRSTAGTAHVGIQKTPDADSYPVSDGQRRLWTLSQTEEGSVAYNMTSQVVLNGDYEIEYFIKAVEATIDRHEILRTVFKLNEQGELRQTIVPRTNLGFTVAWKDVSMYADKEEQSAAVIKEDVFRPFNLTTGPLLRAILFKHSDNRYIFYYNLHHIICDGWSLNVLAKDVLAFYDAFKKNKTTALTPLRIQYRDYAIWQSKQIADGGNAGHRTYWQNKLGGELPVLDLPGMKARPKIKTYNGASFRTYIPESTKTLLHSFVQERGGSLFMVLLSAWNAMLYRYTSNEDIIIGSPVAGREHPDVNDQIGFYVNMLPLRTRIAADDTFSTLYDRVKESTLQSYDHRSYPFDRQVEDLQVIRDTGRSAIFDVILVLQNTADEVAAEQVAVSETDTITALGNTVCKYDMDVVFRELNNCLAFQVIYNSDIYEQEMITAMMKHFKNLLSLLLTDPEEMINAIEYISAEEKQELLFDLNATQSDYPTAAGIVDLFREQVQANADRNALIYGNTSYTYRQLDELSGRLANHLHKQYEIKAGDRIGIQLERDHWTVISILGILKLGAVYVPIDVALPDERKQFIREDAQCILCIDSDLIGRFEQDRSEYMNASYEYTGGGKAQVYIMYTSGSTGKPKGVIIHEQPIIRLVKETNYITVSPADKILGLSNFAFDGSTFDIFMPLLNGATLVISGKDVFLDLQQLNEFITLQEISSFFITTALFNTLVEGQLTNLANLKYVLFGGELVSVKHVKRFRELYPAVHLHHVYGPTENTTFSTWYAIQETGEKIKTIPIGRPISNSECYILDVNNRLVPKGVMGEMYVGGDGLSAGYLNLPELNNEKFIEHPFKPGRKLYKTGDYGRWLFNGEIEFMGRKDDQVKIRGHRIELGDIEHALLQVKAIDKAVVIIGSGKNDSEIIAYYTSARELGSDELKRELRSKLPGYMLPARWVWVEHFPLNNNGKIDKGRLPEPDLSQVVAHAAYVAPSNKIEEQLVKIWEQVLNREHIGVLDDFFELGGHSLKAVRVLYELQNTFQIKTTVRELYQKTTIRELAEEIGLMLKLVNVQKTTTNTKILKI